MRDLARAGIVGVLYFFITVGAIAAAGPYSGVLGALLVILALVLGPFAAAWVARRVVPGDHRLLLRLAPGAIAGAVLYFAVGGVLGRPLSRFSESSQAPLVIGGWILAPAMGAFALSRWKRDAAPPAA